MIDQIEYNRVVAENIELTKQRDELAKMLGAVIPTMAFTHLKNPQFREDNPDWVEAYEPGVKLLEEMGTFGNSADLVSAVEGLKTIKLILERQLAEDSEMDSAVMMMILDLIDYRLKIKKDGK